MADKTYCERLRRDYLHDADLDDDALIEKYAHGRKYAVTWDHIGDAYAEFEKLADAYLAMLERRKK